MSHHNNNKSMHSTQDENDTQAADACVTDNQPLAPIMAELYSLHDQSNDTPSPRNERYELVVKKQPQSCLMSGMGELDHRPISPAPIVELFIYDDDGQSIDFSHARYPPCLLHASLWSQDQAQKLDTVHITSVTNPLRTMTGTLASSPKVIRNHQHCGLYFSFPDIGFRVAEIYCLRFDLVILAGSTAHSITHVYSDPFTVNSCKD